MTDQNDRTRPERTWKAQHARRARSSPAATSLDGLTVSAGPPDDADLILAYNATSFLNLTQPFLQETMSRAAGMVMERALAEGRLAVGEVEIDLVWRWWALPSHQHQQLDRITPLPPWPLRSLGTNREWVYIRIWSHSQAIRTSTGSN